MPDAGAADARHGGQRRQIVAAGTGALALSTPRAIGAVVARFVHTEEVTGSNPVSPTRSAPVRGVVSPSFLYARSAYPFLHTLSPPRGPLRAHPCVRAPRSARIPSLPAGRPFLWACPHRPDVTTSRRPCVLRAPFQPCLRRAPRETTPNRRHAPGHGASDARLLAPGHRRPATGTRLPEPVDPLVTCPSLGVSIWQDWAHHRFVTFV